MKSYLLYSTSEQLQQHFGFVLITTVDQMVNGLSDMFYFFQFTSL